MKRIQEHTKKELLQVVRSFNLHNSIKGYSKLKKNDLITSIKRFLKYDSQREKFTKKRKSFTYPLEL